METVRVLSPSRPLLTLFHILHIYSTGKRRIVYNFSTHLIIISDFLSSLVYIHYKLFKLTPLKWLSRNKVNPKKAFTTSFFWYMVATNQIAGGGGCGAGGEIATYSAVPETLSDIVSVQTTSICAQS